MEVLIGKEIFSEVNYRRIIFCTLAICMIVGWLFSIDILRPYTEYEMIFAVSIIMFFYFIVNDNKDEFLFIAIIYVLIQSLLNYLVLIFNISPSIRLGTGVILFSLNWRIDTIIKDNIEKFVPRLSTDYFNLVYINSAKSYEIATLIDDTVKTTIQKENSNVANSKNSLKVGIKNNVQSIYEQSNEFTTESKVSESFEIKSTKSTIFRKVYEMSKSFDMNNPKEGDLVKFDNIHFYPVNAQDIPLILEVLQSSKLDNPITEGIELNMSNLLSTFLIDYTIDYSFKHGDENFLVRFPYGEVEGFENGYRHSDFQLGQLSLVGIDRGNIDFSEVETVSTKFLKFMSENYKKNISAKKEIDIITKSSLPETVYTEQSEFEVNFDYQKLIGTYHLIDVIAVVQRINMETRQ